MIVCLGEPFSRIFVVRRVSSCTGRKGKISDLTLAEKRRRRRRELNEIDGSSSEALILFCYPGFDEVGDAEDSGSRG